MVGSKRKPPARKTPSTPIGESTFPPKGKFEGRDISTSKNRPESSQGDVPKGKGRVAGGFLQGGKRR